MEPVQKTVELPLSQIRLTYKEWHGDKKETILALHGWLDNAASFDPMAPHFRNHRLIALDLPGHGFSDHRPPGATYHFWDYIQDIWQVQEALGLASYILMGHSLGAAVASFFTGVFPEKVRELILIEGLGAIPGEDKDVVKRMRQHIGMWTSLVAKKERSLYPDVEKAVSMRLKATPMAPASARLIVERGLKKQNEGYTWRSDPRLTLPSPLRLSEGQIQNALINIHCPTFLLIANDGLVHETAPYKISHRLSYIPQLQFVEVEGQHHVHMDQPEIAAKAIKTFLRQRSSE